jgi:hypothetical protein
MAINYTYPVKTVPTSADDILIIDNADSSKATKRIAISTLPGGSGTVTSVTATTPLVSTGGTTPSISLTAVPIALGGTGVTTGLTGYLPLAGGAMTGPITTSSTFAGRNVATDGTKLDGVEALADVTDVANVTAAGALMESAITNVAQVKSFDSSDYATAAQGTLATNALPLAGGTMTGPITMSANINMSNTSVDGGGGSSSTISNMYSVTGNQIISASTTLTPSSIMAWDTGTGSTLILDVASSGTSVSTFNVNNLSVGATATIFLNSTSGNSVAPSAWSVLIGGLTQTVIWAGGVIPTTPPSAAIRKDKLTFTSNGVDVYGVAHEGFL